MHVPNTLVCAFLLVLRTVIGTSTTTICSQPPPHPTYPPCPKARIMIARATGECMGPGVQEEVADIIMSKVSGVDSDYVPYPAIANSGAPPGHFFEDLPHFADYVKSEQTGVHDLTFMVQDFVDKCPDSKVVLMGYSQGAQVTGDVLCGTSEKNFPSTPPLDYNAYGKQVVAVVLYGDPSHLLNEPWDVGNSTKTSWFPRQNAGPCLPYASSMVSYCDAEDTFCDCGQSDIVFQAFLCYGPESHRAVHKGYISDNVYTTASADFVIAKLNAALGKNDKIDL